MVSLTTVRNTLLTHFLKKLDKQLFEKFVIRKIDENEQVKLDNLEKEGNHLRRTKTIPS